MPQWIMQHFLLFFSSYQHTLLFFANRVQSSLLELPRCSLSYTKKVQIECNQACLNCQDAAFLMQRKCKSSAIKLAWIAEMQPFLCKESANHNFWTYESSISSINNKKEADGQQYSSASFFVLFKPKSVIRPFYELFYNCLQSFG